MVSRRENTGAGNQARTMNPQGDICKTIYRQKPMDDQAVLSAKLDALRSLMGMCTAAEARPSTMPRYQTRL